MKKLLLGSAFCFFAGLAHANLIITAVFDGPLSGGVPKGVELYALDDIADLSIYGVGGANNGGGTDGEEFSFPADSVSAGDYVYLATEAESFEAFFGFAPDYTHGTAVSINGDDAIELFENGVVIDLFGDIDVDGTGQAWDYLDGWAARASGASASPVFDIADWTFSGPNALDGETTNDSAATPIPLGSYDGSGTGSGGGGNEEPEELTLISQVQGNPATYGSNSFGENDVSPLVGQVVAIQGIVVGDFQDGDTDESRNLSGFFVQEETSDEDGDASSSEGVFVYSSGSSVDVNLGDLVRVVGTVDQYFSETQLSDVTTIDVLDVNRLDLVTVANISLGGASAVTLSQDGYYQPDLEAYEGMLVSVNESLQISEQFQLDRFNEIKLVTGERPWQFTQIASPDPVLYDAHLRGLGARRITYDDGLNVQNANIANLDGFSAYNESNAKRMGDVVANLTGVLDYKWAGNSSSGSTWRVRSHADGTNVFTSTDLGNSPNPRPDDAPDVTGSLKIASFNVLNYFSTIDLSGGVTAAGHDPRGADSAEEFSRQTAKTVNAILQLDADILGLIEIENEFDDVNDGSTAIEVLVNELNMQAGSDLYDYVYPGSQFVGTDAIAVAFIYKPDVVALAEGSSVARLDDESAATLSVFAGRDFVSEPIFNGVATNRVSLAASFTHLESGDSLTLVANHFKSKGASGLEDALDPNFDQLNGAGFWNQRRLDAALAVSEWLKTSPTGLNDPDQVILGDLNAYAMEEPVQYLLANGFVNSENDDTWSYVFDGQIGTLDYVLLSESLVEKVSEVGVWHINADEADALDYNLDFGKDPTYFDGNTATRNSDHDPVIVGFNFVYDETTISDVVQAYLVAYQSGEVIGTGRHSLLRHLNGLKFLLLLSTANELEERGKMHKACKVLEKAAERSDGNRRPKDLIEGAGLVEFNALLEQAITDSCCS